RSYNLGIGDVISLLHFDGANTSTTFVDETGRTWSASGSAQISTAVTVFDGQAGLFDGTGDYISTAHDAVFTADADMTCDGWIYCAEDPGRLNTIVSKRGVGSNPTSDYLLRLDTSARLHLLVWRSTSANSIDITSTDPIVKNTPTHV